jgi:hypothetical protein
MTNINDRRRAEAMKALAATYERLGLLAGSQFSVGDIVRSEATEDAERKSDREIVAWINGAPHAAPRSALAAWEASIATDITRALNRRGCDQCKCEKVVEIVDPDGVRSCGCCRAGMPDE